MIMKLTTVENLLQEELKDIYDAEKRLVRALPKMAKAASSPELRSAFEEHLEVTKNHVVRLEQVFELFGWTAKAKACAGMKGLVEEGDEVMAQDATPEIMDAALIGAAQRVEHYEMAAYGTARALAEQVGNEDAAELLEATLNEEKEADEKLTEIAAQVMEQIGEGAVMSSEESSATAGSGRSTAKARTSRG
jgi:ferritin-like metal-binding protein YciE